MSDSEPRDLEDFEGVALPPFVRTRLVGVVLAVLSALTSEQLPPPLRRVASFAPAKRSRLAVEPIVQALDGQSFRGQVVAQLKLAQHELLTALDGEEAPAVDRAAAAYLVRGDGSRAVFDTAVAEIAAAATVTAGAQYEERLEQLRRQLSDARAEVAGVRDRYRHQIAALKADNTDLRHKVNDWRTRSKQAGRLAEDATEAAEKASERAHSEVMAAEAENRRLKNRLAEIEADLLAARRVSREDRDVGTVRARLLLDTLVDAAQGLRRELALPPVDVLPADTVTATHPEASVGAAGRARALDADDPTALEELIALPKAHLIIDGYNVTKQSWGSMSLAEQRTRLLREMGGVQARSGAEVTVVFDGADLEHVPTVTAPRGIRVLFSPPGVIADRLIADLLRAEPAERVLVVVSSDGEVAADAIRSGGRAVASRALVRLLGRT